MSKQTVLHETHQQQGGLMVDFAGWKLPLHYGSQIAEHQQVREDAGMFDVSHMGIIDIWGLEAKLFLRYLLSNNIDKLKQSGQALYSCLLNEKAGIIDDLIVYYLGIDPLSGADYFRLVVNAAKTDIDLAWISLQAKNFEVNINHRSDLAILALQGPRAREKVSLAFPQYQEKIQGLKAFHFFLENSKKPIDRNTLIAATGYTGEDGLEIIMLKEDVKRYWDTLLAAKIQPIGIAARDTLRLEAGFNLSGQDMDETLTPLESNLAWTVALEPSDRQFIGRSALSAQQAQDSYQKLVGIILLEKGILRRGQKLIKDNECIGVVTSGTFSPTLKKSIALARIHSNIEEDCWVEIRNHTLKVKIVQPPFVRRGHAKNT